MMAIRFLLALGACLLLGGCFDTKSDTSAKRFVHEHWSGSFTVPLPQPKPVRQADGTVVVSTELAPVAVPFDVARDLDEGSEASGHASTTIDTSALAGAVGKALQQGASSFLPALAPLFTSQPPAPEDLTGKILALVGAGTTVAAGGYAALKRAAAARATAEAERHRADADEAWDAVKQKALTPPAAA